MLFVYRTFEKLNMIDATRSEIMNYSMIVVATVAVAVLIVYCWRIIKKISHHLRGSKNWQKKRYLY